MHGKDHRLVPLTPRSEGVARCEVCGAAEGELLWWCPGYRLNEATLDACYRGNVVDMGFWYLKKSVGMYDRRRS